MTLLAVRFSSASIAKAPRKVVFLYRSHVQRSSSIEITCDTLFPRKH